MALHVFVVKTDETDETVTYGYGGGPDELDGSVSIDKATGVPVDEAALPGRARIAVRAVYRGKAKSGDWPHHYTYAA
jgi:hypothetical protein